MADADGSMKAVPSQTTAAAGGTSAHRNPTLRKAIDKPNRVPPLKMTICGIVRLAVTIVGRGGKPR